MGTEKPPEGGSSGSAKSHVSTARKPAPLDYAARWYPPHGVDACKSCGNSPAFLAKHLRTGKLASFEESGMPHRAVCAGVSKAARRWHAQADEGAGR
jgi:hypothetical protein